MRNTKLHSSRGGTHHEGEHNEEQREMQTIRLRNMNVTLGSGIRRDMTDWGDKKDKIQKQTDADIFQRFNIFYPQL